MSEPINVFKAYQYFKDNFVMTRPSPKKWYGFDCPFCGKKKKCAVQFRHNRVKCWSCGIDGDIVDFIQTIEKVDRPMARKILWNIEPSNIRLDLLEEMTEDTKMTVSDIVLPFAYNSLLDGKGMLADRARNALKDRNFNLKELDMYGFGYCNKHNDEDEKEDYWGYIIIPYKRRGKLVYYIGRDYMGNFLRYKNPGSDKVHVGKADVIFNEDALGVYDTVFVLEGALDAVEMGKQATATSGWKLSKTQMNAYFSSKAKRLVFIPDIGIDPSSGQTFYQKAVQLGTAFLDIGKQVHVVDLSLYTGEGKDANEIGRANVLKIYKETPPLTLGSAMEIIMK